VRDVTSANRKNYVEFTIALLAYSPTTAPPSAEEDLGALHNLALYIDTVELNRLPAVENPTE
jgi:hypothetical protein